MPEALVITSVASRLKSIPRVLTQPATFFKELAEDDRRKHGAIWVVLLVNLVHAAAVVVYMSPQANLFPPGSSAASVILVGAGLLTVVSGFIEWLVYGLIVRMTAGMEAKPWAVAGYSTAPLLIVALLVFLTALLFPMDVLPLSNYADPQFRAEAQATIQQSLGGRIIAVLTYLYAVWHFALIFIGVREVTGMPHRAVRTVVVLGLLYGARIIIPWLMTPVL